MTIQRSHLRRRLTRALCLALCLLPVRVGSAQQPADFMARFFSDSTLWQRILTHVVTSLSTYLVRTGVDPNPQPWQITLPDSVPQRDVVLGQLRTILRARPVTPSDTRVFTLVIGDVTISNDTARVSIRTDFARRCPGTTALGGFGSIETVIVRRFPRAGWGIATTAGAREGARAACAGPW